RGAVGCPASPLGPTLVTTPFHGRTPWPGRSARGGRAAFGPHRAQRLCVTMLHSIHVVAWTRATSALRIQPLSSASDRRSVQSAGETSAQSHVQETGIGLPRAGRPTP